MKQVSKEARKVIVSIIDGLGTETSKKININGYPDSAIMAVDVEIVATGLKHQSNENCFVVSIAHYYEQNGDLMADPLMEFLVSDYRHIVGTKEMTQDELLELVGVWPSHFRQDGIFQRNLELIIFDDGKASRYSSKQKEYASFCTGWMRNIKWQQKINTRINSTPCHWGRQLLKVSA